MSEEATRLTNVQLDLRTRVRLLVFLLVVVVAAAVAVWSRAIGEGERSGPWSSLALVMTLVVVAALGSNLVAFLSLRPVERLIVAMRESTTFDKYCTQEVALPNEVRAITAGTSSLLERERRRCDAETAALAGALHDLKAPLAGLRAIAEVALDEVKAGEALATHLSTIRDELSSVQVVVHQTLDFARTALAPAAASSTRVAVEDVVMRVVGRTEWSMLQGPEVRIERLGAAQAWCDPVLLERVFENVLINARRAALSKVVVRLVPGVIDVEDDGPGLSDHLLRALVSGQVLYEAARESGLTRSGHGLGFIAANRMANEFGGRLAVKRTSASGTTIAIYYPTAAGSVSSP